MTDLNPSSWLLVLSFALIILTLCVAVASAVMTEDDEPLGLPIISPDDAKGAGN
ncbi:MAG: hypothetical protein ACRYG5_17365 [Janthinobacterium lividum]